MSLSWRPRLILLHLGGLKRRCVSLLTCCNRTSLALRMIRADNGMVKSIVALDDRVSVAASNWFLPRDAMHPRY